MSAETTTLSLRDVSDMLVIGEVDLKDDTEVVINHYNNKDNSGLEIILKHPECAHDKVVYIEMHGTHASVLLASQYDLDTEVIAELKDDHTRVSGNRIGHPAFEFRHDEVDIVEGWSHSRISDFTDLEDGLAPEIKEL